MIEGRIVSMATVIAIFLSNVPEGLSSSVGMKRGRLEGHFNFFLHSYRINCGLQPIQ
ncbi:MAG: Zinc/iron permease [Methanobacteriaceae archaeon 41_258]|nr:MAG: Zinc/iron permease [Methanobacteriaceae archaeon 41_258]